MALIDCQGTTYTCREGETVLDAALRQGIEMTFSCRSGGCHACMHQCTEGTIPAESQKGIDAQRRELGYFLPCMCRPTGDMTIVSAQQVEATERQRMRANLANRERAIQIPPDPEMWRALGEGSLLFTILDDFYTRVYNDERLASFFHEVTKQRAIEKQYLFLRQILTGEKVYFGDRPRNAHHWMVISDELFDYREELMASCLRHAGLAEPMVKRWLAMEERFRAEIVKAQPVARTMNGVELPLDGFGDEVLEVGSLCDGCGQEIAAGVQVRYHLRLGKTYCPSCVAGT
jgi:ferredoxin/truncated hemoglobin YjbI